MIVVKICKVLSCLYASSRLSRQRRKLFSSVVEFLGLTSTNYPHFPLKIKYNIKLGSVSRMLMMRSTIMRFQANFWQQSIGVEAENCMVWNVVTVATSCWANELVSLQNKLKCDVFSALLIQAMCSISFSQIDSFACMYQKEIFAKN